MFFSYIFLPVLNAVLDRIRGTSRHERPFKWLYEPFLTIPMGASHFYLMTGDTGVTNLLLAGVLFHAGMAPGWSFIGDFLARRETTASERWQIILKWDNYHVSALVRGLMIGVPMLLFCWHFPQVTLYPALTWLGFHLSLLIARQIKSVDQWHASEFIRGALTTFLVAAII